MKCHFNYEGPGTNQLDDGFSLTIDYTLLHTHPRLTPRMSMFVVYINSQSKFII